MLFVFVLLIRVVLLESLGLIRKELYYEESLFDHD